MAVIQKKWRAAKNDIGFQVQRALPAQAKSQVGPFVFLDHMGPARFAAGSTVNDVRPHPHIGLATVTYLISGALMHRDSLGTVQRIEPGAVNLMSAGHGIVHSERIPDDIRDSGTALEGIQMWVALPAEQEESEPGFWHYEASQVPVLAVPGVEGHVICGHLNGVRSKVVNASPTLFAVLNMRAQSVLALDTDYSERAIYVACGSIMIDGEHIEEGETVTIETGEVAEVVAAEQSRIVVFGGEPVGRRYLWWNFVATTREKIIAAKERWARDEFPKVPNEHERIPLPDRKLPDRAE